jgi:hypothetical protein
MKAPHAPVVITRFLGLAVHDTSNKLNAYSPEQCCLRQSGVISSLCGVMLVRFVTESYNMIVNCMRHLRFHDRGPHRLLLAGLRAARGKVTTA